MKKHKKTKARKQKTLFGGVAKSLKKLSKGAANGLGGLSTAQKVAGGAALVALGLNYLAKRRRGGSTAPATETAGSAASNLDQAVPSPPANADEATAEAAAFADLAEAAA